MNRLHQKLLSDSAVILLGQLAYAASQWLFLVGLTRYIDSETAGTYALVLSIITPVFIFFDLNLRVVRSTHSESQYSANLYSFLRLVSSIPAVIISLLITSHFEIASPIIIVSLIIIKLFDSYFNLIYGSYQQRETPKFVGFSMLARSTIYVISLLVLIFISTTLDTLLIFIAVLTLIAFLLVDQGMHLYRHFWDFLATTLNRTSKVLSLLKTSAPLAVDALISSLILNVGRYSIGDNLTLSDLAKYAIIFQLVFSVQIAIGAIGHASIGTTARLIREENKPDFFTSLAQLRRLLGIVLTGYVLVSIFLIFPILEHFNVLTKSDIPTYLSLLAASVFAAMQRLTARLLQAFNKYHAYLLLDVVIFTVVLISTLVLVPKIGAVGAGLSLTLGFFVGTLITLFKVSNHVNEFRFR